MGRSASILLIEDDLALVEVLRDALAERGHRLVHAATGREAMQAVARRRPDLIVLDLMLPDADGMTLYLDIRATTDVPVLVCSGTQRRRDMAILLRLGVADFIAKPFEVAELQERVERALGRPSADTALAGSRPRLTRTEARLLGALLARPGSLVSHDDLARAIWGTTDGGNARAIATNVCRIRAKLAALGHDAPAAIVVRRGHGYRAIPSPPQGPDVASEWRSPPARDVAPLRPDTVTGVEVDPP